ncbi:MAG: uroporphyrinogen-III synthase, partial [Alphaproteobacteria bacterium]
ALPNPARIIHIGTSDGAHLAAHLATQPTAHFTHLHGNLAEMEWHAPLTAAGHTITPLCAYTTTYAEALPPEVITHLPRITHILLFSAGSTKHLLKLLQHGNMLPCLHPSATAVALSPKVAQAAAPFPRVVTASHPTLTSLIHTLRALANAPSGCL